MGLTVTDRFEMLLNMSGKSLLCLIDLYNADAIENEDTKLAMEALDGFEGPGDEVHVAS